MRGTCEGILADGTIYSCRACEDRLASSNTISRPNPADFSCRVGGASSGHAESAEPPDLTPPEPPNPSIDLPQTLEQQLSNPTRVRATYLAASQPRTAPTCGWQPASAPRRGCINPGLPLAGQQERHGETMVGVQEQLEEVAKVRRCIERARWRFTCAVGGCIRRVPRSGLREAGGRGE